MNAKMLIDFGNGDERALGFEFSPKMPQSYIKACALALANAAITTIEMEFKRPPYVAELK